MNLIIKAARFAEEKHRGQVRKYSGDPYIVHPGRVANKVLLLDKVDDLVWLGMNIHEDMVCAAWLHDVLEDCGVSLAELRGTFNHPIAELVEELTNVSKEDKSLNRAGRKKADIARVAKCSRNAKIIKLCDRIDNLRDIPNDEPFKAKYLRETEDLYRGALIGTHSQLESELNKLMADFWDWYTKTYFPVTEKTI